MRLLKAKWAGKCFKCGVAFAAGAAIAWTGHAWHPECHAAELEADRAEDARRDAENARWLAARKAGELITLEPSAEWLMVRGAACYEDAKAAARAAVASILAAGGKAALLKHRRGGKSYLGREVTSGGMYSSLRYHEGWSFRWSVEGLTS